MVSTFAYTHVFGNFDRVREFFSLDVPCSNIIYSFGTQDMTIFRNIILLLLLAHTYIDILLYIYLIQASKKA